MLMVKPGMAYLDIVQQVKSNVSMSSYLKPLSYYTCISKSSNMGSTVLISLK